MDFPGFPARLAHVRDRIAEARRRAGVDQPVRIVAVTKTHDAGAVRAAAAAGLDAVGESRVQEALPKMAAAADVPVAWHLIGSLQRNKARQAVGQFALIHSVDRADLARELDRRATARQRVLVQVNCSREPQKGGVAPEALADLLAMAARCARLEVAGLMTMAAADAGVPAQHRTFAMLRELRERLATPALPLAELSMGMSDDFEAAVAEGATMVRLGSVLFGART